MKSPIKNGYEIHWADTKKPELSGIIRFICRVDVKSKQREYFPKGTQYALIHYAWDRMIRHFGHPRRMPAIPMAAKVVLFREFSDMNKEFFGLRFWITRPDDNPTYICVRWSYLRKRDPEGSLKSEFIRKTHPHKWNADDATA